MLAWVPLAHGLVVAGFLLVRWASDASGVSTAPPEALWPTWRRLRDVVALLEEFTPYLFLPLPLWILAAALAHTRRAAAAAALPWGIFAVLYGTLFLPPAWRTFPPAGAAPASAGRPVRVMAYNVGAWSRPPEVMAEMVGLIRAADPDVLLLEELNHAVAGGLEDALATIYPYSDLQPGGWEGMGLFSRLPVLEEENWQGSVRGARWQHVVLDTGGRPLHLVHLHLITPGVGRRRIGPLRLPSGEQTQSRAAEIAALLPQIRTLLGQTGDVIVAGDLNLTDQTTAYRQLRAAGLVDAYRSAGWGLGATFPANRTVRLGAWQVRLPVALVRLDYVLTAPEIVATAARVWPASGGSDHFPTVTDLIVQQAAHS